MPATIPDLLLPVYFLGSQEGRPNRQSGEVANSPPQSIASRCRT